jgi:A/G-specific adenine glycosylase
LQDVLKLWEGLGYYARARNLHRAAKRVLEEYEGQIPNDWKTFHKLPGVGEYIASAVQSIAFAAPHAVTDGNVKRVLARLMKIDAPVNQPASHKVFREAAGKLLDTRHPGNFNQAMMELGAMVCKPRKPKCGLCPIPPFCLARQTGQTEDYPKRIQSKPVPKYHVVAGVIYRENQILIVRRKAEGLLGGLWEFPGGKISKKEDLARACLRKIREKVSLAAEIDSHVTQVKHAYTHFKIVMDVFQCRYVSGAVKLNGSVAYQWIRPDETDQYPFPKAHLKAMNKIGILS